MRSVQTNELAHCSIAGGAPAGVAANGTVSGVSSRGLVIPHPSFWVAFAPRELPRFLTTTHPLTPARWLFEAPTVRGSLTSILRPGLRASELHPDRAGLFVSWLKSSRHSVSTHLSPPSEIGLVLSPRLTAWAGSSPHPQSGPQRLGLRHCLASSPLRPAVSSSSSYGLAVLLPLLPTPLYATQLRSDTKLVPSFDEDSHLANFNTLQTH